MFLSLAPIILSFILCLLSFISYAVPSVYADYARAYSDYTYQYSQYRQAHGNYQIAKSSYLTYRTLTAQAKAVAALREVIKTRAKLFSAYLDLLYEKIAETAAVPADSRDVFGKIRDGQKQWLTEHQKKADAAATLPDLNSVSAEFTNRFPQMDTETKQAVGIILSAKENVLSEKWEAIANNLSAKIQEINASGEDTGLGERGITSGREKKAVFAEKLANARQTFGLEGNIERIDLFAGQKTLAQANQYLREAVNYLLEVVKWITG